MTRFRHIDWLTQLTKYTIHKPPRRLRARLAFKMKRKQFEVNVLRGALYSHCDADKLNADTCTQRQTQLKWNRDGAGDEREKEKGRERGRREWGQSNSFLALSFTIWSPLCASLFPFLPFFLFTFPFHSSSPFCFTFLCFPCALLFNFSCPQIRLKFVGRR